MSKKICIVEDNPLNLMLFQDLVEAIGHDSFSVTDGALVIEEVEKNKPDLIIMDIQLPNISGTDLMLEIKSRDDLKHIPIIAVTSFALQQDEKLIREYGCDSYLPKPLDIDKFNSEIKRFLENA